MTEINLATHTQNLIPAKNASRLIGVIDGHTRLMGMLGDPITQVRTPQAINPIFEALGENITCIPIHVRADELEQAWAGLKAMRNLVGFSVTIPHKNNAYELCDSLDPGAERVGAVNVVRREHDGQFRGYQFDGLGFVKGLESQGHEIAGRNCLLLGAGGAAAAISFALVDSGVQSLRIANRSHGKARSLSDALNAEFGSEIAQVADPIPQPGDLVVNATSLGLNAQDCLPLKPDFLEASMLVADLIANPEITRLLAEARRRGAEIHSGIHMVENQVSMIARHMIADEPL